MSTTKVRKQHVKDVYKLALLGATHAEIADFFEITEGNLTAWIKDCHQFNKAVKMGKLDADAKVSQALFKRATGYTYREQKAFSYMGDVEIVTIQRHLPCDVNAAKFWLKNRQADKWREQPSEAQTAWHDPWEIEYTDEN